MVLASVDQQQPKTNPKSKNPSIGLLSVKSPSKMTLTPQWLKTATQSQVQKPEAAEPN